MNLVCYDTFSHNYNVRYLLLSRGFGARTRCYSYIARTIIIFYSLLRQNNMHFFFGILNFNPCISNLVYYYKHGDTKLKLFL